MKNCNLKHLALAIACVTVVNAQGMEYVLNAATNAAKNSAVAIATQQLQGKAAGKVKALTNLDLTRAPLADFALVAASVKGQNSWKQQAPTVLASIVALQGKQQLYAKATDYLHTWIAPNTFGGNVLAQFIASFTIEFVKPAAIKATTKAADFVGSNLPHSVQAKLGLKQK